MCSLAKRFCGAGNHFKTQQRLFATLGEPLTRFGVITDTHYADREDRIAWYDVKRKRHYRNAIVQIKRAFDHWNRGSEQFVVQLGDLIDGSNRNRKHTAIRRVMDLFESNTRLPAFHVIGNHELYNFNRIQLAAYFCESLFNRNQNIVSFKTHENNEDRFIFYYTITPNARIKLLMLDCFDVSVLGHTIHCDKFKRASHILNDFRNNFDKKRRRFAAHNGALGELQLKWLDSELTKADMNNEKVIVCGHIGIHPDSVDSTCLLWNYEEVLNIFSGHCSMKAYLCGHSHRSGYSEMNGIHFISFHGAIEASPDSNAFASISVFETCVKIDGYGVEESRLLSIA